MLSVAMPVSVNEVYEKFIYKRFDRNMQTL